MAMGSTGTVNMTPEMLRRALEVINEYRSTADGLHTQLDDTVGTLLSTSFSGSAADGFKHFYDNTIQQAIGEGLSKLLDALQQIIEETLKAIPDVNGLDDQLGEGNRQG
jgi:uncharacterized protein YukE